ncbi:hypothetical protein MAR_026497 [Mya arenaria]|uniref:THD domain-containing protein n=1 Tax=Mya arenaria TaxID=6604 RepID=A0ABY7ET14_MYAAR|nr:uncharacterized protein LOC128243676 [Mya arenaria]WAR12317.1 hypothetical protein MAR_026497 [Mya arenaria]
MAVKHLKLFGIVSLVLLLTVIISVIAIILSMPDVETIDGNKEICFKAENGEIECGPTVDKIHLLFETELPVIYNDLLKKEKEDTVKYIKEQDIQLQNPFEAQLEMKPSARLVGARDIKQSSDDAAMTTVRSWRHDKDLHYTDGFQRYGIRYQNGRMIVPLSGTYSVHSFLTLRERINGELAEQQVAPIRHSMYRFNVLSSDEEIGSCIQSRKNSSIGSYNYYSSQVSTVLRLNAGDEISVKINDVSLVDKPEENFFGVNMI